MPAGTCLTLRLLDLRARRAPGQTFLLGLACLELCFSTWTELLPSTLLVCRTCCLMRPPLLQQWPAWALNPAPESWRTTAWESFQHPVGRSWVSQWRAAARQSLRSWTLSPAAVWSMQRVRANLEQPEALLLDARPAARFHGEVPEPRAGMRGGHIPGSLSLPFGSVLSSGSMRPPQQIRELLAEAGVSAESLGRSDGQQVVTSCGSGMTACVVGLALHQVGLPLGRWAVYDGSWSEWGASKDTPIVRKGADGKAEPVPSDPPSSL
ncbi:unnamed protein product [Polarella glacialis]|uniref:Rhodanese domain-containing protein n=1 Tax=Polarella glacialis TaxID=89957 RepID=A0A813LX38_POLGL|nr:unnamed protein product [Polarella glacialis]